MKCYNVLAMQDFSLKKALSRNVEIMVFHYYYPVLR